MNKNDLIKKLENVDLPEANLPSHQRRLKTALLNSGYWKEKTFMSLLKKLTPVGAVAVVALLIVGVNYFKNPSSVSRNSLLLAPSAYAQGLIAEAQKQLTDVRAIAAFPDPTTGIIQWKTPDVDGNIRDEKGRIIFVTDQNGKLVPAPHELPNQDKYYRAEELEKMGGYPNALFNDMAKAKNTAYYYVIVKPAALSQEQISALRTAGVRMIQLASRDEIEMLKNTGVGISDEKSIYDTLIEENQAEKIKKLDFVVSVTPRIKAGINGGGVDLNIEDAGSSDEVSYTVSKDSFLNFLKEAKQAEDLVYLGNKVLPDGKRIKMIRYSPDYSKTDRSDIPHFVVLGIGENNLPVVRIAYTYKNDKVGGGIIFQQGELKNNQPMSSEQGVQYGKIDLNAPQIKNIEEMINFWTENLENQPQDQTDFNAIQK